MMPRILLLTALMACFTLDAAASDGKFQQTKKNTSATRVESPPQVDGLLDEDIWMLASPASDFIQIEPYNGKPSSFQTEVYLLYDDFALYVGAKLHDPSPDSIFTVLNNRDQLRTSDYFGVYIDPYNDALNAYGFIVSAAGVQTDLRSSTGSGDDLTWNAVWRSDVQILEDGWSVEMEIPYSALRFPERPEQTWGLNMVRNIQRYRENTSWNFVDRNVNGMNNQAGMLSGIADIHPPVRFSLMPYTSSYVQTYDGTSGYSLKGGMDLKLGISESFTLDMMLIPDFGQVQSDDQLLNLSPFEVYFDERRPFFMEGTELFNRGNIFYSRRIGSQPTGFYQAYDELGDNEVVEANPSVTQLANATKITGKTANGLGIGLLNALSLPMHATLRDTLTGATRDFETQPMTNYNVVVLDQSLPNNSFFSLTNTHFYQPQADFLADVSAYETRLTEKTNTYSIWSRAMLSQRYLPEGQNEFGHKYAVAFNKISGKFLFGLSHELENDSFDPNELGFLQSNNEIVNRLSLEYNTYEPRGRYLWWRNKLSAYQNMLYKPRELTKVGFSASSYMTFRNQLTAGAELESEPFFNYDYFEPRVAGRFFDGPRWVYGSLFMSSDYRKPVALDLRVGSYTSHMEQWGWWALFSPRMRVGDKLLLVYTFNPDFNFGQWGFVEHSEDEQQVYFGLRDIRTITNIFDISYIITNRMGLTFRARHYSSTVRHSAYGLLTTQGKIEPISDFWTDADRTFDAFNIDMVYTWQFLPGSEMSIVWKNAISQFEQAYIPSFRENIERTFTAPASNSISIRLLYFLDYANIKRWRTHG